VTHSSEKTARVLVIGGDTPLQTELARTQGNLDRQVPGWKVVMSKVATFDEACRSLETNPDILVIDVNDNDHLSDTDTVEMADTGCKMLVQKVGPNWNGRLNVNGIRIRGVFTSICYSLGMHVPCGPVSEAILDTYDIRPTRNAA
jgi:hypothetical protein